MQVALTKGPHNYSSQRAVKGRNVSTDVHYLSSWKCVYISPKVDEFGVLSYRMTDCKLLTTFQGDWKEKLSMV